MILSNRPFTRREPVKNAKSIFIYCEGKRREFQYFQYFQYFQGIDSRINIVIYSLEGHENNSPTGLYQLAARDLLKTVENPSPKFELLSIDEVWFVIDTDAWGTKVNALRSLCENNTNWKVAQSHPCFEVWLYVHHFVISPDFREYDRCEFWKNRLSEAVSGGFNSKKHPIFIGTAIQNAKNCFKRENGAPAPGCTEVFELGEVIWDVCSRKIEVMLSRM
jgi:hypothetical protein